MNFQEFLQGKAFDAYEYFGAHLTEEGAVFRVYAPNAANVEVQGDFSGWKLLPMLCGILLLFVLLIFYTKRSRKAVSLAIVISFGILLAGQAVYRASEQRCFLFWGRSRRKW